MDYFQAFLDALTDPEHHQGLWVMVQALGAVVGVLILLGAAWAAFSQLNEARTLRLAQMRPFVVIDFHVLPSGMIYVRISNLGTSMARKVRFSFDRPLVTKLKPNLMELQIFKSGIESLPPGHVIETFFDAFNSREGKDDRYVATITYEGEGQRKPIEDTMDLDLGLYSGTSPVRLKGLHEMAQELERIAKVLDGFGAHGGGLLAVSDEDLVKRHEAFVAAPAIETPAEDSRLDLPADADAGRLEEVAPPDSRAERER